MQLLKTSNIKNNMKIAKYRYILAFIILFICSALLFSIYHNSDKSVSDDNDDIQRTNHRKHIIINNDSSQTHPQNAGLQNNRIAIPSIELIRVENNPEANFELLSTPLIRNRKFTTKSGTKIELNLLNDSEVLSIAPNISESHFLVAQGAKREFSIYDSKGVFLLSLPTVDSALPELNPRTPLDWRWKTDNTLIASLGFISEVLPNQYPERPTELMEMRFYFYDMQSKDFCEIKLPRALQGNGILRLDGITMDGLIKLSLIPSGIDYSTFDDFYVLGYFRTPE